MKQIKVHIPSSYLNLSHHFNQPNWLSSVRYFSTEEKLTHVNEVGHAYVVDITNKKSTLRTATAKAIVRINAQLTKLIKENCIKKGDVLSLAQIAGIIGAKKTSEIVPLCHNILLTNVKVMAKLDEAKNTVNIEAIVKCEGQTGVEMEALTAVSVASLAVYDMCKSVSHDITIGDIELVNKTGGTKGPYYKPQQFKIRDYETAPIDREAVTLGTL